MYGGLKEIYIIMFKLQNTIVILVKHQLEVFRHYLETEGETQGMYLWDELYVFVGTID